MSGGLGPQREWRFVGRSWASYSGTADPFYDPDEDEGQMKAAASDLVYQPPSLRGNTYDWMEESNCGNVDPALFVEKPKQHKAWVSPVAEEACAACPVALQCLAHMLAGGRGQADYAAGYTAAQRERMVRENE